jgi:hypothetical protein
MKLTVSSGGVPVGSYLGRFVGVEKVTNDFGDGLAWRWEIVGGPHAGQRVGRITTAQPTTKNVCGKILAGLIGKPLSAGEQFDLDGCVGKTYLLVVAEGERGGTRVESVTTAPIS